jgi:hypothetical protein
MERIVFLVESTGARIPCLLNPDTFVVRRTAGIRPRRSASGQLAGAALTDDPLVHTGGGRTELELDLLFDTSLSPSPVPIEDVRDLTRPITGLAENVSRDDGFGELPLVRFIWGRYWNIAGIVTAFAERLEDFTPEGAPRRSWLRVRFLRIGETVPTAPPAVPEFTPIPDVPATPGTPFTPDILDLPDFPGIPDIPGLEGEAEVRIA